MVRRSLEIADEKEWDLGVGTMEAPGLWPAAPVGLCILCTISRLAMDITLDGL